MEFSRQEYWSGLPFLSPGDLPDPGDPVSCINRQILYHVSPSPKFHQFQFSHSVMANSLRPHGLQHAKPPCPSPTPGVYSNSCPLSQWYRPTISSSVVPFSCLQSFPASESFPMSQFLTSGGQSIGASASASVLPMNIQDWFSLGLMGLICHATLNVANLVWPRELNPIYICANTQHLLFSFWLSSLSITGSRFIHLSRTDSNLFFFMA